MKLISIFYITMFVGGYGNGSSQLQNPFGVARDLVTDTLYIADYTNSRVMSYVSGASLGTVAAGGNGAGFNNTQLRYPVGLHLDSVTNSLVIGNFGANNIVRWKLGDDHWTLLAGSSQGNPGNTSTLLNGLIYITLDPMGNMYVADRLNHRIQLFMTGQSEGITIAGLTSMPGNSSSVLANPWSAKLDGQLNLYVADSLNHRIQKFLRY